MIDLRLGDCLDVMGTLADGSVDLVLADLPYGTTKCRWDSVIDLERLWAAYRRLLTPRGTVVLTASQPFTAKLVMSNPLWFRYEWIWHKNIPTGFLDARRKPLKAHESILVFSPRAARYEPQGVAPSRRRRRRNSRATTEAYGEMGTEWIQTGSGFPRSVLRFASDRGLHTSQKPVALMEYLVRTYTQPGQTVLDNCMGSGTTGLACVRTGRRFIGIERDESYFRIASDRIHSEATKLAS